jgi:uncharacterized membrane protein YdjX (TVP38/TMEM64 family)
MDASIQEPSPIGVRPLSRARQILLSATMILLAIVLSALLYYFRQQIAHLSKYGYLGLFLVNALSSASVFLPIPGLALAFMTGSAFNPLLVGLAVGTGGAVGELVGYLAGYSGRTLVGGHGGYQRVVGWMKRYGLWVVFVLAMIPNPLFDAVGIVSGALRIPLAKFFAACWAGNVIKATTVALAGMGAFRVLGPGIERWLAR